MSGVAIINDVDVDTREAIDEIGSLLPTVDAAKKVVSNYESRIKVLKARLSENIDPETTITVAGESYVVELGEQGSQRKIRDLGLLIKTIGAAKFMEIAKVNISDIEALAPPHLVEKILESSRTGSRTIKFVKRAA